MSMYGPGSGSPYSGMHGPMSPGETGAGEPGVGHPSHSPGSVKSETGGSGPPTGSSTVSMGSGSPGSVPLGVPPPAGSGGPPSGVVKREPLSSGGPPMSGQGSPPQVPQQQDLNRMISMYLPGDAAAAAAGDPNAQSRINSLTNQVYAGHYGSLMAQPTHGGHSPEPMGLPPASAYQV